MPEFILPDGGRWWALVLALLFATGWGWFCYARTDLGLSQAARWGLTGLRCGALTLVVLLWYRPVISVTRVDDARPRLVCLLDTSASMSIADQPGGATRLDLAREQVGQFQARLAERFDVQSIAFAESAHPLADAEQLAALRPDGPATSLTRALQSARAAAADGPLAGVLLLSDGQHNAAGQPAETARNVGAPVYAVGVGSSLRGPQDRDLWVADLVCPDEMPVENRARILGYVDATGFAGRLTDVELLEDDVVVATAQVVLDDTAGNQEVILEFVPHVQGVRQYALRMAPAAGERIAENNQRGRSAHVVESRIRVLYLEGTLRKEYGALTGQFLSQDPLLEFTALVQTRPGVFSVRSNQAGAAALTGLPEDAAALEAYDVVLLGDVDSQLLSTEQLQLLAERVRAGLGLLMLGGYHSLGPGGYAGTPLDEALPVFLGPRDVGQINEPLLPALTVEGRAHPIFANIAQFFPSASGEPAAAELPPLLGCVRVLGAKPGASTLAVYAGAADGTDAQMPILAVQTFGLGRTAAFTGDTTANWRQVLAALERDSPFLRFWGQLVRWLARRDVPFETAAGLTAEVDKTYCEPAAEVRITAVVRGVGGVGLGDAQVQARVSGPDGQQTTLELAPQPGATGNYAVQFEPPATGRYEIRVSARAGEQDSAAEPLYVEVGRPYLEFDKLELDVPRLTAIARASGGRYYHLRDAGRLLDELQAQDRSRRTQAEIPLTWSPLTWLLIAGMLSAEWLARRRRRLR